MESLRKLAKLIPMSPLAPLETPGSRLHLNFKPDEKKASALAPQLLHEASYAILRAGAGFTGRTAEQGAATMGIGQGGFRRVHTGAVAVALIIAGAIFFIIFAAGKDAVAAGVDTRAGAKFPCTVQSVYDGDGPINCSEVDLNGQQVRVRLRGIEARESDNSCRHANICPKASGAEAKAVLTRLAVGRMECTSFGPSYNRVDAACRTPTNVDVSCEMLRSGTAVRWPEYDPEGRLIPCVPPR